MTPMTLNKLVTEMIDLKKSIVVSESCDKIRRLVRSGVAMNISAR